MGANTSSSEEYDDEPYCEFCGRTPCKIFSGYESPNDHQDSDEFNIEPGEPGEPVVSDTLAFIYGNT